MTAPRGELELSRLRTGIPGLDSVLGGGFFCGSCNLVIGAAGTGKTVFGTQMAFHQVRRGGRALYMTLLTESHSRLIAHISTMSYFEPSAIGDGLYVVSGARELSARGLKGLLLVIRRLVRERKATLLVLDGLSIAESMAGTAYEFQRFVHEINTVAGMTDCAIILLANADACEAAWQHPIVDTIVVLDDQAVGLRASRTLRVVKMRGSQHARGAHLYRIDRRGARVFPRFETTVARRRIVPAAERDKLSTGVSGLDEMLEGGIVAASTTLLLGAPGSGKTLLGLSFLAAGARRGEHGVYFGFYESPPRLVSKGDSIGLGLAALVEEGKLSIAWQLPLEQIIDDLVRRMLALVKRTGARRLFIDGLDGFALAAAFPERLASFCTALANRLTQYGVTTLISQEAALFSAEIEAPLLGVSAAMENIFFLRYVEHEARLRRLVSIVKLRESPYDSSLRELRVTSRGLEVAPTFEGAGAIMSGWAREGQESGSPAPAPSPRRARNGRRR